MLQTSDKSTKKPQLPSLISIVKTAGLAWACRTFLKVQLPNFSFRQKITHNTFRSYAANNQKNILLSNATPIGVYKMQSADCTQVVLDCRSSRDVYKTWTGVHGPPWTTPRSWSMDQT